MHMCSVTHSPTLMCAMTQDVAPQLNSHIRGAMRVGATHEVLTPPLPPPSPCGHICMHIHVCVSVCVSSCMYMHATRAVPISRPFFYTLHGYEYGYVCVCVYVYIYVFTCMCV